jgi:hypothetical protein
MQNQYEAETTEYKILESGATKKNHHFLTQKTIDINLVPQCWVFTRNNDFHYTLHDDNNKLVAKFFKEPRYRPIYLWRTGYGLFINLNDNHVAASKLFILLCHLSIISRISLFNRI